MQWRPDLRVRVWENTHRLRAGLEIIGLKATGQGPIVPLIVGSSTSATRLEELLLAHGYWCAAAVPPLVAPDACRLRLTVTAMHTNDHIDGILETMSYLIRTESVGTLPLSQAPSLPR